MADVFVTGGTGYMGRHLIPQLIARGHRVRVLARAASVAQVPAGAEAVVGDALDAASYARHVLPGSTLVHLVGTPHPSPVKAAEFERVDRPSIDAAVSAAVAARVAHLVYVSVAHPAPIMAAYIEVRSAGERAIAAAGLTATILRPWYVLGPGRWWPAALRPMYALLEMIPATREHARRLGLVTIDQMVRALIGAVEDPPAAGSQRLVAVPAIRAAINRLPAVPFAR